LLTYESMSEGETPTVRAGFLHALLELVDQLPSKQRDGIYQMWPKDKITMVRETLSMAWLPGKILSGLMIVVINELGLQRTRDLFRNLYLNYVYRGPLLASYVGTVDRIVANDDPGKYLRWVLRGYQYLFHHWGEWKVLQSEEFQSTIQFYNFPPACLAANRLWLELSIDSLDPVFEITQKAGKIKIIEVDEQKRTATYLFTWV
jgi:hypothetical protein